MSLLDQLLDLEKSPKGRAYTDEDYNLDGFRAFVESIGSPHLHQRFIHVAGTRGKGSVVALCDALLRGVRFSTAAFTSPHLAHFGERFRVNGIAWTEQQFLDRLEAFYQSLGPEQRKGFEPNHRWRTVFETLTALALREFALESHACDASRPMIVCWETGLGGRLDCTNIVDPIVSVITTLALDHQSVLGPEIEDIAREKAGIIKPGRPVIIARQAAEFESRVLPILIAKAAEVGAPVIRAWEHNPITLIEETLEGQRIHLRRPDGGEESGLLPLLGDFQRGNLEAAIAAVWYVIKAQGRNPSEEHLLAGLSNATWPGRLEILHAGSKRLVLDGAHCPFSGKILGTNLARLLPAEKPITVLFAMQNDKNQKGFLSAFADALGRNRIEQIIIYPLNSVRGATTEQLAETCESQGFQPKKADSMDDAMKLAYSTSDVIVAAGTLYSLAAFKNRWKILTDG